ncbi:phenylalanine--tRNA ligase subunit beta [Mangrovibacillus cuniculi]|uniref:Phenylalanine--tRNA ligase beta subunit n=1 Tax=Mangrovibacillus cuniculi TaxID=2593652 RepID=A0A7S8CBY6_9BACI|nr:phenylalanine--tRNA ligase subunit beta [Mangrovibacillus cuniculi]QPC47174.1 phenylalanine--tRNA ligase subunit beta [Mangrovibacillus cuniculi]
MFVSYKWLQEYVDVQEVSAEKLADLITRAGVEVEGVEVRNEGISGVVVGHVLEKEQHPDADKLNKCLVDIGAEEPVQIICGAPNVDKGQKVAVATVGAVLPGNFKIKKAKLRGEASHGMICSLQELGVEGKLVPKEYAEGIYVFPSDAPVGEDALEQLHLNDAVLELGLTPNRSDCLSMLGVAYEVATILGKEVKLPEFTIREAADQANEAVKVMLQDHESNPHYVAKVIKNVTVKPSPVWMQARLAAAGIRPINNVVDITNYVLMEYGQPLHAFDYDRFGSTIVETRKANAGETIVTLDGEERKLTEEDFVITNGKEAVALAGVMGGEATEVSDSTTTVLLESAYFNPQLIRQASKRHGLRSESSARFEKGVDPNRVKAAANRAAYLLQELAGGTVLAGEAEVQVEQPVEATVQVTMNHINSLLGTSLTVDEVKDIFTRLQFTVKESDGTFDITVPTRRGDITIPQDLIEEVGRIYGYDVIPSVLPTMVATTGQLSKRQRLRREIRSTFEGAGLKQAITYSLTSESKSLQFALEKREPVKLALPMSEERSRLRLSIVPQLLEVVAYNQARQLESVAVYELGSVFLSTGANQLPEEKERLAVAVSGNWHEHAWQGEKKAVDFYVVKGIVEALSTRLQLGNRISFVANTSLKELHPGRTADILLDGEVIGYVGQVHPIVQKNIGLKETYVVEMDVTALESAAVEALSFTTVPRYPSITRDIALVVESDVTAGSLQSIILEAGKSLLKEVKLFDLYEGEKMEEGKKSLAFSLKYMDPERTLTDEEVVKAHDRVLTALQEKANAVLRG